MLKKIKLNSCTWSHHRSGWKFVIDALTETCHVSDGILCEGVLGDIFRNNISLEFPWIGFLHETPYVYINDLERHNKNYFLDGIFEMESWKKSELYCKGIFTFSKYAFNFIQDKVPYLPIFSLKHPTYFPSNKFSMEKFVENKNKKLIFVGDWLRNIASIYNINCRYDKMLINVINRDCHEYRHDIMSNYNSVNVVNRLDDDSYDALLSENIVFTHLYESSANNTILECISRNTPILVNKLSSVVEYLGEEYPLLFNTLDEAEFKVNDLNLIEKSHNYLCNMKKDDFKISSFINYFVNSFIYQAL